MARNPKAENNLQVFRGSRSRVDVFSQNADSGCCGSGAAVQHDKLADRVRFDNALAHSNPTGANDKFIVPYGDGFSGNRDEMIAHINANGVGAQLSVLVVPTYAFVTGVGVHIAAEEEGLTFNIETRNGLELPASQVIQVSAAAGEDGCAIERTQSEGSLEGFGALDGAEFIDIFARDGDGTFSLEADEIILTVATMPTEGIVTGAFDLTVSISYDVIHSAER